MTNRASGIPDFIPNWIGGQEIAADSKESVEKYNPATGERLLRLARSQDSDIKTAVAAAKKAQLEWADIPVVKRGMILHEIVLGMKKHREEIARIVALETGKSFSDALGETDGAAALGLFYASEGQRFYGRTTTSGVPHKLAMTFRCPVGVAGLIIAANTPIANVAWKVFPALLCGNGVVFKAAEDTPATAWFFGRVAQESGLPDGVLNIVQGLGNEAGAALVAHPDVGVVSFTGSTQVGREIAAVAGKRLAKVSLELGGKNPMVICDDADLENAVHWAGLSAFSNGGQRCASGSRFIVMESVYELFKSKFIQKAESLRIGPDNTDDYGPVINQRQLNNMLAAVDQSVQQGAVILTGGKRYHHAQYPGGYYMAPTVIENAVPETLISRTELFGPIALLYKARDFTHALALANDSPYGLTSCIHTRNVNRALEFTRKIQAGVAVVNAATYGSEPHMPFGGYKDSGNGSREPGTEALDVYSELKDVYMMIQPNEC